MTKYCQQCHSANDLKELVCDCGYVFFQLRHPALDHLPLSASNGLRQSAMKVPLLLGGVVLFLMTVVGTIVMFNSNSVSAGDGFTTAERPHNAGSKRVRSGRTAEYLRPKESRR
jgi:hypothetical protein